MDTLHFKYKETDLLKFQALTQNFIVYRNVLKVLLLNKTLQKTENNYLIG